METTKCRSCNADIVWIEYDGKKHPVNASPKSVFIQQPFGFQLLKGYESHFSSCPQAGTWRTKKLNNKGQTVGEMWAFCGGASLIIFTICIGIGSCCRMSMMNPATLVETKAPATSSSEARVVQSDGLIGVK